MDLYSLQELLPNDIIGNNNAHTKVHVPDWAFKPDHWTTTLLRGLKQVGKDLAGASLWEIGVGTGVNQIVLKQLIEKATCYFSDYNPDCVPLALSNLKAAGIDPRSYHPLGGRRNLVFAEEGQVAPKVDVVFGCLPQVPTSECLEVGDRVAHYYDPKMFPRSSRHVCGLALNEALLGGARKVLSPKGKVILNLSGRPGEEHLHGMFEECGYESRVLYEAIVPQHSETSLESLAAIELQELCTDEFEFFADPEALVRLNAQRAEARRVQGKPVYHKIFVMEGTLVE